MAKRLLTLEVFDKKEESLEDGRRVWEKQDNVWNEILKIISNFRQPNCPQPTGETLFLLIRKRMLYREMKNRGKARLQKGNAIKRLNCIKKAL